jgi:hypothetical protein
MRDEIKKLFGGHTDAYTVMEGRMETVLDNTDVALVLDVEDNLHLFLPGEGEVSDHGLALVEVYNLLCKDKARKDLSGFTQPLIDRMKAR